MNNACIHFRPTQAILCPRVRDSAAEGGRRPRHDDDPAAPDLAHRQRALQGALRRVRAEGQRHRLRRLRQQHLLQAGRHGAGTTEQRFRVLHLLRDLHGLC